ncbi:uncharacterized protein LOC116172340 [Photinus pyralis]|nr:uncharacterized protein LOC116172340 [Photinus pyralis]
MKTLTCCVLLALCGLATSAFNFDQELLALLGGLETVDNSASINDYIDSVLVGLNQFLDDLHFSNVDLPVIDKSFQYSFFSGKINLENGTLNNLNTIERANDSVVKYAPPYLRVYLPLKTTKVNLHYEYQGNLMGMTPEGVVNGNISHLELAMEAGINLKNLRVNLFKFHIEKIAGISLVFEGPGFITSILNGVAGMLTPTIEELIPEKGDEIVKGILESKISELNKVICEKLNDC